MLLRDALDVSGLTQRELAVRCAVHESHLCRILAGKARPSERLYRDLLLALYEELGEPSPKQPWRVRIRMLHCASRLTSVQVQVLVALHHGHGSRDPYMRFPYFITTAKALHRRGFLQSDRFGYGHHLTPASDALIQKWMTIGIYDEVLTELQEGAA